MTSFSTQVDVPLRAAARFMSRGLLRCCAAALVIMASHASAVDLNTATQAQLESVKGIGPKIASVILEERKKAAFKDLQDFQQRVPGIGEKKAAALAQAGLTIGSDVTQASTTDKPAVGKTGNTKPAATKP